MTEKNYPDFSKPNLPTEDSGHFTGERGNSAFIPNNQKAREALQSFGADSVKYVNGYPDFSPFTVIHDEKLGTVDGRVQIGHMTADRSNPKYVYGRRTDGHAPDENLGNFAQADNELAKALNDRDGTVLTGKDIQEMRKRKKLTWHEVEDGKTMYLVPTPIHAACPHSGGVSVEKDLHRIADSDEYDFDTGEYNAMDYTYAAEEDLLIPIHHNRTAPEPYVPRADEYAFTGKVDANPQYGNGGATQYYVPYANEMKEDGRLVPVERQVEDVNARTGSGEPKQVKEYTDENGVHTTLDYRPMDPEELKELEESIPESAEEAEKRAYDLDDLSEEELADSIQDGPSEDFYRNYDEEYKHPLTNQENSGGAYSPDGWQEPTNLQPGQRLYQVSVDGDTKSCYFTDQETIDSCSREDGSVNFEALREKLQIGEGDDKITLTAYEFRPEGEGEQVSDAAKEKQAVPENPEKAEDDVLAQNNEEETQAKPVTNAKAEDDVLAQNNEEETQTKPVTNAKAEDDVLAQNNEEENQAKPVTNAKAEDDVLAQNNKAEDRSGMADGVKSEDGRISGDGDESKKASTQEDEDVLAQNTPEPSGTEKTGVQNGQSGQAQGGTEQGTTQPTTDAKDSGNSRDNGMGME